jgi:hypothetical protein
MTIRDDRHRAGTEAMRVERDLVGGAELELDRRHLHHEGALDQTNSQR